MMKLERKYTMSKKSMALISMAVLFSSLVSSSASASSLPEIRDLNMDPISIQNTQNSSTEKANAYYAPADAPLKSGISEINSVVGKSQLMRFDEPIKRVSIANPDLADVVIISQKEILVNGKAPGTTSLIVWGDKPNPVFFDVDRKSVV